MKLPSLCEGHAPRHSADRVFLAAPDHSRAHLRGHQIQQLVDGRNHTSAFTAQNVSAAQYAKLWALGIPKMAATVLLSLCVQILLMASRREKTVSWDSSFIPLDHIFTTLLTLQVPLPRFYELPSCQSSNDNSLRIFLAMLAKSRKDSS